jgi:hypothetical protein
MSKNFLKSLVIIFTTASIMSVPFTKPKADTLNTITRSQAEQRAITMMDLKWKVI